MKNILTYCTLVLVLFGAYACKKEYEAPGSKATMLYCVVPQPSTQIHDTIYFGDLSSGVKSRKWTFPSQFVDIIDSDNDRTSESATVAASFSQIGIYPVHLHVEFDKALINNGELNGLTEIDTTYFIRITDSVKAYFVANYIDINGNDSIELDLSPGAVNTLWGGEKIRFTSLQYGSPTDYGWKFPNANPVEYEGADTTIVVQFPELGLIDVTHYAYRRYPEESYDTVFFPGLIEVIPSERPALVVGALKTDRRTLEITFSQNVDSPAEEVENFSLTVLNDTTPMDVNIAALELHPQVASKIIVRLDADVYDDDIISISYTPGTFANAYEGVVAPIVDYPVSANLESALPDYFDGGFENSSVSWIDAGWGGQYGPEAADPYVLERSTDIKYAGASSLKITLPAGENNMAIQPADPSTVTTEEGRPYLFSFRYYSPPGHNSGAIGVWGFLGMQFEVPNADANDPVDWVQYTEVVEGDGTEASFVLRAVAHTELVNDVFIYLDEIRLDYMDRRP